MTQISRPLQIGLAAIVLLAAVWLVALRGHSSSSSGPSSTTPPATAQSSPSGGSSTTYKGSAPGVAGLSNAIAKAHSAVTTSQQNAKQLEEKANQASSNGAAGSAGTAPSSPSAKASPTTTGGSATTSKGGSTSAGAGAQTAVDRQKAVEEALAGGNVVLVLFWDNKGADDVAVHDAVRSVAHSARGVVVLEAPASQVASFGSITRGIGVYGTPTLLVVGAHGRTTVLTGLTDPYSIQQAIDDARRS